jgi:alanyl-tRNA synthetase
VPHDDPTLLFANAGMNQFKRVFMGEEHRDYNRAVTAQRCVRAGGKHNDLENVGYTARHHTFFEMLGNFSFGDYFKERAIDLAWTLLTREYDLDPKRLLVTVYHDDDVAFDLWKKISGLPEEKIIRIATSDNFWSMGDTGPCGPCSEIFFDHGEQIFGGPPGSKDEDGDRFVEIWNLVFMQYEQQEGGERLDLPKPSIDTGMGLERITAVLQGTHDNYETDLFRHLIAASEELTGVTAHGEHKASHRVIADHLRAAGFLVTDGVLPSNEGRGYVLRRIMRRAMRHAELLGSREPLMHRLVPVLVQEMGQAFPDLARAEDLISETLYLEESRFRKTLDRGLKILEEETASLGQGDRLSGEIAFKLYDTYGFPYDLTEDALRARGIGIDRDVFDKAMERQRAEARAAWAGSGDAGEQKIWFALRERLGASEFLGYETEKAEGVVTALVVDGEEKEALATGDKGAVITNQTPFYGESGGQIGDRGTLVSASGAVFDVTDTQKKADGLIVHLGVVRKGALEKGEALEMTVHHGRRSATRANHSATHILHEALRRVLGTHVMQKGSHVGPERLRFDFSHQKAVSAKELAGIEQMANQVVWENTPVNTRLMAVDEAIEAGAMALFGEKYGEEVRVVSMGGSMEAAYSVELCGGTHVRRTGDIGLIKIIAESAVASGVRRIEAVTREGAKTWLDERSSIVTDLAHDLKTVPDELGPRVAALVDERKQLAQEVAQLRRKLAFAGDGGNSNGGETEEIAGIRLVARVAEGVSPRDLRSLVDEGKKQLGTGVAAILAVTEDGKAGLAVGVTKDLVDRINAVDLVRAGAAALGGNGGGGRPDMAQAGGPDGTRAQAALDAIRAVLAALDK